MNISRSVPPELPLGPILNPASMQLATDKAAGLLRALGNGSRLIILCHLARGECSVSELRSILSLSQSALSQHLGRLRREGLVEARRVSRNVFYSLAPGPADALLDALLTTLCRSRP